MATSISSPENDNICPIYGDHVNSTNGEWEGLKQVCSLKTSITRGDQYATPPTPSTVKVIIKDISPGTTLALTGNVLEFTLPVAPAPAP